MLLIILWWLVEVGAANKALLTLVLLAAAAQADLEQVQVFRLLAEQLTQLQLVVAVLGQQRTIQMEVLEEVPYFLLSHLLAVAVAAVFMAVQVQVAVLAVVAVKLELLAAQEIRQAQAPHKVIMVEILVVLTTT
jgi:hypothetical protein